MHVLDDLVTPDVRIMNAGGIAFGPGLSVFLVRYGLKRIRHDADRGAAAASTR